MHRYVPLPSITTFEFRCSQCGGICHYPTPSEYDSPMHVMLVEEQQRVLMTQIGHMGADLMDLARECLDAGVRPEILRRADKLREILDEWIRRMEGRDG